MKASVLFHLLLLTPLITVAQNTAPELSYKIPKSLKAGELYSFRLNMARNQQTGGCLIEMEFPFGFIVNEQQSEDALFSFSDSKLEFQWLVLPEKDTLNMDIAVLIPENAQANISVPVTVTYTLNDVRIEKPSSPLELIIQAEAPIELAKNSEPKKRDELIVEARAHVSGKTEFDREEIRFRLQVGAFKSQVNKEIIANQFGIPSSEIVEFKHQGMFKYAFGNFSTPTEAKNSMKRYTSLKDKAFVIGFKNGKRVNLEEAIEGSKEENE